MLRKTPARDECALELRRLSEVSRLRRLGDVGSLWSLGAIFDHKLNFLAFFERLVSFFLDGRKVHEHIGAFAALNEPIALDVAEPLDFACDAVTHWTVFEQYVDCYCDAAEQLHLLM